ncbi:glycosyltransferase family 4 protein [Haloarchaeobius sp. HRN-SO-5]|uniref:glycosyltransferase family 4 protein n=1 Tax=Haloarchaeobius sp. HRN-SO-5 TaxID=3446118 RepID=UPI003EC083F2
MDEEGSEETLRILALNKRSWEHPKAGGSELNLEATLKRLSERGHEVHLLTGSDQGQPRLETDGSVVIHRVGFDGRLSAPWDVVVSYLTISVYFYWALFRLSPDTVYTVDTPLPWPVVTRRPRIAIFHHVAIDSFFDTHPFPQNLFGYLSQWAGVLRERKTPTVSVSPSTTQELVSRGHNPETVYEIRNGMDLEQYSPGRKSETPRIVYVGGLERYKGVDRISEIHHQLREKHESPVRLDIAGRDGPVRADIEDYCNRTENAHFHGFVSMEKKIELLQSAWVFIAPSRVEGWGIAVLEANACRTPAVGSDVSGLRDSIRDGQTGVLVDGANPEEFALEIDALLDNDERRETMAEEARRWSEEHSWEESVTQLEQLFLSVTLGNE